MEIAIYVVLFYMWIDAGWAQDIVGCGGFVKSEVEINYSLIEVKLYTKQGSLKYQTDCAPNNGYYLIPVYDKGEYQLRVEPPPGWTFEPQSFDLVIDGKTDLCSRGEDINFQFTGFGIIGVVTSIGEGGGPMGVTVSLKKVGSKDILKQTTTAIRGMYTFENVLPGDYIVEGTHPKWKLNPASTTVKVDRETSHVGTSLSVLGFDVQGKVYSEGEPIKGVRFVLFTEDVRRRDIHECDKTPLLGFATREGEEPVCHVVSGEDGTFTFPSLPSGNYKLVPFYKGDHITFDVMPSELEFRVGQGSMKLKDSFKVIGFSVNGRVTRTVKGAGVGDAQVLVDGKPETVTKSDGTYHLDGMKTGTYSMEARARDMHFDPIVVKVTPNTPHLPDMVASKFTVTGRIIIDKMPDMGSSETYRRSVKVIGQGVTGSDIQANKDGHFEMQLQPGKYILKVFVSPEETAAGLSFVPAEKDLLVIDQPVHGVNFFQFRAKVTGTVTCLSGCGVLVVSLASLTRPENRQLAQTVDGPSGSQFTFNEVMPGKYRVTIQKEEWCWKEKSLEVEVLDKDYSGLSFTQSGFVLSCSLSHDLVLNYAMENKPQKGTFNPKKGVNKFCLTDPGLYRLTPVSCHKFEHEVYKFDTSNPTLLTLTAIRHKLEGSVVTVKHQSDIMIEITSSVDGEQPSLIKPVSSVKDDAAAKDASGKPVKSKPKGPVTYTFQYWARSGEKLKVTPLSKQLLFYPKSIEVTVRGDKCPGEMTKFEGREGLFVTGQVQPPLSGVSVTITDSKNPDAVWQIETDDKGLYSVGPLDPDTGYDVSAQKVGYVLTPMEGMLGHFQASKLGEISVVIHDEASQALAGVLVSLSGGENYRSNNLTHTNGSLSFTALTPGQYFLRAMMKEYQFDPASKMIQVLEGATVDVKISGKRVAFSCYGAVTSLNGEPEAGVFVEALGRGSEHCQLIEEDGKTEQDGSFRIRGLQPDCEYDIRLKSGDLYNQHIERAAPNVRTLQMVDKDLTNVHIIAFRRMNQMDLSGNVITAQEYLTSLKVHLLKEKNLDAAIHTVTLGSTSFFYLPSLTLDNQEYRIRLESSLSRTSYDYTLPEIAFTANKTYKHFTVKFEPKKRNVDQDLNHSSVLLLPLTVLIGFIIYNYQKIVPVLSQVLAMAKSAAKNRPIAPAVIQPLPKETFDITAQLLSDTLAAKKKHRVRKT